MPQEITLTVNGQIHKVHIEPDTPLLYVLRNDLGLKGAKFGCGLGHCGACKIIIDGQAVSSCRISVGSAQGRGHRSVASVIMISIAAVVPVVVVLPGARWPLGEGEGCSENERREDDESSSAGNRSKHDELLFSVSPPA